MPIILIILFSLTTALASMEELARQYSPTVIQGLGVNPIADEFTRVDFDGDWIGENNWYNMDKFPRPATVYYDVIEGEIHYVITYVFFYPRDYATVCFWVHCHENDLEGMKVVVEKTSGQVIELEALAHNFSRTDYFPSEITVVIEKEGHGIHPLGMRKIDKNFRIYYPNDYELRPLKEIWDQRDSGIFKEGFSFFGVTLPARFKTSVWTSRLGGAKPPWSWDVYGHKYPRGSWFLDPFAGTGEKYLYNPYLEELGLLK